MGFLNMERTLRHNGLKATGVVSADAVQAYKPIFDEALRVSGCTLDETIHIGNTYDTYAVGLYGAWFNRGAHHPASNPTPKNFAPKLHHPAYFHGLKVPNSLFLIEMNFNL